MYNQEMPGFKVLVKDSWKALTQSFGNLLLLSLFGFVIGIVILLVIIFGVAGIGFLSTFSDFGNSGDVSSVIKALENYLTPSTIAYLSFAVLATVIFGWVISTVMKLGSIVAVGKQSEKPTLGMCLRQGLNVLIPTFVVTAFVSLLSFGASFLFIIPGILIAIYFGFTEYELVLGNKRWFDAARGSVRIMSQHFGAIVLRMIVFFLVTYALYYVPVYFLQLIIDAFAKQAPTQASMLTSILGIFQFLMSILLGFYGLAYSVVTYQHAKSVTDEAQPVKLTWIWILSILGWIIATLLGIQVAKLAKSPVVQEKITELISQQTQAQKKEQTQSEKIDQWINSINPAARPYWDQSQDLFTQMHANIGPAKIRALNDQNIVALKKAAELNEDNPAIWSALSDAYTWISTSGTLEDSLKASRQAERLDPSIIEYQYSTGNILLRLNRYDEAIIKLEKVVRAQDNHGMAHIDLGIAYSRNRIADSARMHLQKGIDILTPYNTQGAYDAEILQARKELATLN